MVLAMMITLLCAARTIEAVVRIDCVGISTITTLTEYNARIGALTSTSCNTIPGTLTLNGFNTLVETQFHFPNLFQILVNLNIEVSILNSIPTRMNVSLPNVNNINGDILVTVRAPRHVF